MAISEKIELLGKGLYKDIPDVITLKGIPTASELDYVGGEDFIVTMLDTIFPKAIEEQFNYRDLLEIDFQWICRCLRILNYGPYYTTTAVFCPDCDQVSYGEFQVDLRSIDVRMLPKDFKNDIVVSKDEFIDFDGDIILKLPTIQDIINANKDSLFSNVNGDVHERLARICYMTKSIKGNNHMTIPEIKFTLQKQMMDADYKLLRGIVNEKADYGLRAGGTTCCPKCQSKKAAFMALVDDRFFRPSLGDLRAWKADRAVEVTNNAKSGGAESR